MMNPSKSVARFKKGKAGQRLQHSATSSSTTESLSLRESSAGVHCSYSPLNRSGVLNQKRGFSRFPFNKEKFKVVTFCPSSSHPSTPFDHKTTEWTTTTATESYPTTSTTPGTQPKLYRSRSLNGNLHENVAPIRARPTVSSILRQYHVLEKAEKKEKDKVDSLMVLSPIAVEAENIMKRLEKQDAEDLKEKESKRIQEAKLAYEKARAASRKVADEKQKIAEGTRQKEKEWLTLLSEQREAEVERRKSATDQVKKSMSDSKRAVDDMLQLKQEKASQLKLEIEKLQQAAKVKESQEKVKRLDKIQQIQAAKLALKRTKQTIGNPNQFYRSIAVPETQIKLRLQKEEEDRKLTEIRRKIQAAKQSKSVKLIKAMKKIQNNEGFPNHPAISDFFLGKAY